jgi:hypothetical protein
MRAPLLPFLITASIAASLPTTTAAQSWTSPAEARALVAALQARALEAAAAPDPADPSRFMAALLLPGQLLVVSGAHPAPEAVRSRLTAGDHRGVYLDLQSSPDAASRFFVHDLNADGLGIAATGEPFDNVYTSAGSLSCDGQWKAAKLREDEYLDRVRDADGRYAGILRALVQAVNASGSRR